MFFVRRVGDDLQHVVVARLSAAVLGRAPTLPGKARQPLLRIGRQDLLQCDLVPISAGMREPEETESKWSRPPHVA